MTVSINNKTPLLMSWIQMYRSTTDQDLLRVKVAYNIASLLDGGVSGILSELWNVNATYIGY
jgi:hypothetical protein